MRLAWPSLAVALVIAAVALGGVYVAIPGRTGALPGGSVFVVNRLTGSVTWCSYMVCKAVQAMPPSAEPATPPFDPSKPSTPVPRNPFGDLIPKPQSMAPTPPPGFRLDQPKP
jgi:hypothetical protein